MDEIEKLQEMVDRVLAEAPKKKEPKKKKAKAADRPKVQPLGYTYAEALNFAPPLGIDNLYARQGQVTWGPHTGVGPMIRDPISGNPQQQHMIQSAWDSLASKMGKKAKK